MPVAEVVGEAPQIEASGHDAGSGRSRVGGVDALFDVGGDEHHGFAEVHRLADGFKSGRRHVPAAAVHAVEELRVVEPVEHQPALGRECLRGTEPVPEEVDAPLRVPGAPLPQLGGESVVDHVSEYEALVGDAATQGVAPQQGRNDADVPARVVVHRSEREPEQLRASAGGHPGVEPQQKSLHARVAGVGIGAVPEQELVGDARHRDADAVQPDGQAGEQLVEVDDPVGMLRGDLLADDPRAAPEAGEASRTEVSQQGPQHADAPVAAVEGEAGSLEFDDRGADPRPEEVGKHALRTAAHQHARDLVAVAPQHCRQRQGLREVAAPLALHDEEKPHHPFVFSAS